VHNTVQEICARSLERQQGAWSAAMTGQPLTRWRWPSCANRPAPICAACSIGDQMEEFLLRYSYNAHQLHSELRASTQPR